MKRISRILLPAGLLLTVTACGSSTTDRATTGAGIGAAAGAVVGAVTGLGPLGGALIGGAAGAAAGAVTRQDQVDLGRPVWRQGRDGQPAPVQQMPANAGAAPPVQSMAMQPVAVQPVAAPATSSWVDPRPASPARGGAVPASAAVGTDPITVKNIQYALGRLGYDAGPADGSLGPRTRAAISRYQRDNGLAADGQPSAQLWERLRGRI
jgi:hypothetical protein